MTNFIKDRIRQAFNKASKTYDYHDCVQKKICGKTIEMLGQSNTDFQVVADFACGTGNSTLSLAEKIAYQKMFAIDISESLVDIARQKLEPRSIDFIIGDFDERLLPENTVDLIFCNMGLQWSLNINKTLSLFVSTLRENGILIFSMPLDGTFVELNQWCRNAHHSGKEVKTMLNNLNLQSIQCHHLKFVQVFDTHFDALKSIKGVGANCILDQVGVNRIKHLSKRTKDFFVKKENITLTYQIGIFIAKKEGVQNG